MHAQVIKLTLGDIIQLICWLECTLPGLKKAALCQTLAGQGSVHIFSFLFMVELL